MLWQWQATMHLNGKGYKATLEGDNRDDATSSDATVRDEYVRKNGDLFREILAHIQLRISRTMACIWSIVSDGSEVQLNGNC